MSFAQVSPDAEVRLKAALAERDQALLQLAAAREELNALRLAARNAGERAPAPYPVSSGLGPPPLRYVLVDKANEGLKAFAGPLHRLAKRVVGSNDE